MINSEINAHIKLANLMLDFEPLIEDICKIVVGSLKAGGKVMFIGNGGSAADAQHLAAELSGRFRTERKPLAGVALTTDTSALTAIGNDYGFDEIFSRQITALGNTHDSLIAISTSGNSANILKGIDAANKIGVQTIGLSGKDGGKMAPICNKCLVIPSSDTARIQEMHILFGHILCQYLDMHFN